MGGKIAESEFPFGCGVEIALTISCTGVFDNPLASFALLDNRLVPSVTIVHCSLFLHTTLQIFQIFLLLALLRYDRKVNDQDINSRTRDITPFHVLKQGKNRRPFAFNTLKSQLLLYFPVIPDLQSFSDAAGWTQLLDKKRIVLTAIALYFTTI